jgi:hypothetical protein
MGVGKIGRVEKIFHIHLELQPVTRIEKQRRVDPREARQARD